MRRLVVVLLLGVSLASASGAGGAGTPTGDAAAIAFYRQVAQSYVSVHAITGTRRGFLAYTSAGSSFRYYLGAKTPVGYRPARESLLYVLKGGRIVRFVDYAKAAGLPGLTYLEDASGAWARLARGSSSCYYKEPRIAGFWNQPWVGVFGNFSPLEHSGATVIVRSTYTWGSSPGLMSEVDKVSATSKLLRSETGHLSGVGGFAWSLSGLDYGPTPAHVISASPRC